MPSNSMLVELFWNSIIERRWEDTRHFLSEDLCIDWPHTHERIKGLNNYISLNRAYPEPWTMDVARIFETTEGVVISELSANSMDILSYCCAIFTIVDGKIKGGTEYWLDYSPDRPEWRRQFVEYY